MNVPLDFAEPPALQGGRAAELKSRQSTLGNVADDEFKRLLQEIRRLLEEMSPPGALEEADRATREKDQIIRMVPFFDSVAELVNTAALLPRASELAVRDAAFRKLCDHAQGLVEDSVRLFEAGRFATAQFLAIAAIEEIGKITVARIQVMAGVPSSAASTPKVRTNKSLRSHLDKHYLASCAGAVVNSRLDRILGRDRVIAFLEVAESGQLESVRQGALYYELRGNDQYLPHEAVSETAAREFLVIAAELFSEVASYEATDWEDLLKWAESIEHRIGFVPQGQNGGA